MSGREMRGRSLGVDGRLVAWFELADPPREGSLDISPHALSARAIAAQEHDAVAVMDDPFEAMLGNDDRHAEVVHEARDR